MVKLPIWTVSASGKLPKKSPRSLAAKGKAGPLPDQLPERMETCARPHRRHAAAVSLSHYVLAKHRGRSQERQRFAAAAATKTTHAGALQCVIREIDRREFQYQPGDQEVQDLTQY